MSKNQNFFMLMLMGLLLASCQSKTESEQNELWVYTSLYQDTIADLEKQLAVDFPGVKINFYQAGSEDIAAKVNAEMLAGGTKADVLISSDRFWYEDLANTGKLHAYQSAASATVPANLKHEGDFYSTLSIPVMVLAYNQDVVSESEAPKSFLELAQAKWKGKFSTGSPLASGTNFTTMAFLQDRYGWDFFKKLRVNDTMAEGGNSAVIRRIQNKERPIGWVLLENILRFQGKDERIKVIFPTDGVITHANVLAITKKNGSRELAQKFADWMFSQKGQEAMTRSFMYSPLPGFPAPLGAPDFAQLLEKSFPWTQAFVQKVVGEREQLKEVFSSIMFQ